jgi:hypothetical protein
VSSHAVSTHAANGAVEPKLERVPGDVPGTHETKTATKTLCGATLRNGIGKCRRPAGWGSSHVGYGRCKLHGGNTRTQLQHAAAEEVRAEAVKMVMGTPIETAPEDALQLCIDITRGEVSYCDRRIARLTDHDATVATSSDRLHEELDRHGDVHELRDQTTESTAQLHIWITTRQGAVDRLARYSKMALDAGVAERLAQLDERQTELIASAMLVVVGQLASLSNEDRARVPLLLKQHIGALHRPVIEGSVA